MNHHHLTRKCIIFSCFSKSITILQLSWYLRACMHRKIIIVPRNTCIHTYCDVVSFQDKLIPQNQVKGRRVNFANHDRSLRSRDEFSCCHAKKDALSRRETACEELETAAELLDVPTDVIPNPILSMLLNVTSATYYSPSLNIVCLR